MIIEEFDLTCEIIDEDEDFRGIIEDEDTKHTGRPDDSLHTFEGHSAECSSVACSPTDAKLVTTGGTIGDLYLWRIEDYQFGNKIRHGSNSILALGFSADGKFLASGQLDGWVEIFDVYASEEKHKSKFQCAGGVEWLSWHPEDRLLLGGVEDCTAQIWNPECEVLNIFLGHLQSVTCGDFTPDGKTICTGSSDASLRIWNAETAKGIHCIGDEYYTEGLTCLSISSDSTRVLTGSMDSSVHIVDITTGKVVSSLDSHIDSINCVGFQPNSSSPLVATGGEDKKLFIWDLRRLSSPCSTFNHTGEVTDLLWHNTSNYLITGCMDGKVRVWDPLSGVCVKTFSGHSGRIEALSLSADGNFVVSITETVKVFSLSM